MSAALKTAGVKRINISLDTLDAAKFKAITRTGNLQKVLDAYKPLNQQGLNG